MTGPVDGVPRGNPPVMTYDVAGNAVQDPRELEKAVDLADASRESNDLKDERQSATDQPSGAKVVDEPGGTGGRGQGTSGSRSSTSQPQRKAAGPTKRGKR